MSIPEALLSFAAVAVVLTLRLSRAPRSGR